MPVGRFYLYEALESCDTTGLSGIQLVFFLIGSISVNSTSIISSNILPSLLLTSVDVSVSLNGFNSIIGDGLVNSSGDSYFGFFINDILPYPLDTVILAESTENIMLIAPASTNIEVNLYSDSPCITYHPSLLTGLASPTTDFHTELVFENEILAVEKYQVTFSETGLPSGTSWSVTLNGSLETSTNSTIIFTEANGTYSFTVGQVAGYNTSNATGEVDVSGSQVNQDIKFTQVSSMSKYLVTFKETGLPSGTTWSVSINGGTNTSTSSTITFDLANGNYTFTTTNSAGYSYNGSLNVKVDSSNLTVALAFTKVSTHSSSLSSSSILLYAGIAVVAALIIGLAVWVIKRK